MNAALKAAPRALVVFVTLTVGCRREPARVEDCSLILDRIVEVELADQGFRDSALAARKKEQLRRRFDADLNRCPGRRLPAGALACMRQAKSSEEISHACLR
jgi:hypothetical protein